MPVIRRTHVVSVDAINDSVVGGGELKNKLHLNPSIIPVSGFNANQFRYSAGTAVRA